MKGTCRFNTIYLISSVPQGELNVAKRLEESAINETIILNPRLSVEIKEVPGKQELFAELESIAANTPKIMPLIHLDLHGNKDQFLCANGDIVNWAELGEKLRAINVACGLNLFVAVSACSGGYSSLCTQLVSPAPFFALCGPLEDISAGDLLDDYERFYRTLHSTGDCDKAIEALNERQSGLYLGVPAMYLFRLGWSHYTATYCSGELLRQRIERVVTSSLEIGFSKSNVSQLRKQARSFIKNPSRSFEKARDAYFMYDRHPENRIRFPFKYSDLVPDDSDAP